MYTTLKCTRASKGAANTETGSLNLGNDHSSASHYSYLNKPGRCSLKRSNICWLFYSARPEARRSKGGLELARGVLSSPHKRGERSTLGLAQLNLIAYIHQCLLFIPGTDEQLNRMANVSRAAKNFTPKQEQYLAFIHLYTRLHRRPPAETDMQEYFRVSPPSVHQMVLTLERAGFIRRQPRGGRPIRNP